MTVRYHPRRGTRTCPPTSASATASRTPGRSAPPSPATPSTSTSAQLLIDTLTPLAVEAALQVSAELEHRAAEADALRAAHVERARYHADLARRRYLAVDPANRLVADTLEADWNTALRALNDAQAAYDKAREQHAGQLTDAQKDRIAQLVTDLPGIWNDPATPTRERKRIARLLLTDVTVTRDQRHHHRARPPGRRPGTAPSPCRCPNRPGEPRRPRRDHRRDRRAARPPHLRRDRRHPQPARPAPAARANPSTALIVDHVIRTYQLRSRRQRLLDAGMLTLAEIAAARRLHPHRSRSGTTPELSPASAITTKASPLPPARPPTRPTAPRSAAGPSTPTSTNAN